MGFRMRRSIRLAPGVRMTVTPRSVGLSAGVRGARVSANSRGRVTRTVGIPGTGVSHVKTLTSGSSSGRRSRTSAGPKTRAAAPAAPPAQHAAAAQAPPRPGLLAPAWEKALHRALVTRPDGDALVEVGKAHPRARQVAAVFEAISHAVPAGRHERAHELLAWVYGSGFDPAADPFVRKYLPHAAVDLSITPEITARLPLDRTALGLLLAETKQVLDDLAGAVDVVEQLEPTSVSAVSLAELYTGTGRWQDVVDLTDGVTNEDEPTMYLLVQRAVALREQGYASASRDALREALRLRSRPPQLMHLALVERARTNLADNKRAQARKDLERVLAADSAYPGLRELLDELR